MHLFSDQNVIEAKKLEVGTGLWSSLFVTLPRMCIQSVSFRLQSALQKFVGLRAQVRDFFFILLFCFTN